MTPFANFEQLKELTASIKTALSKKQNKLTGTAGQVVGFSADGTAQAQDAAKMAMALVTTTLTNADFNELERGKVVNISYPNGDGDASKHSPKGELESDAGVAWYVVGTFGISSRVVQIAHMPFAHQRRSFVRYKHDVTWSPWMEFVFMPKLQAVAERISNENLLDNWYFKNLLIREQKMNIQV